MITKAINLKNIKHAKARLSKLGNKKKLTLKDKKEIEKIRNFEKSAMSRSYNKEILAGGKNKPRRGPSKKAIETYRKAGLLV